MQREYMYFYKGFWLTVNKLKDGLQATVSTEDHEEIARSQIFTQRPKEYLKNWAESFVDVYLAKE